MRNNKSYNSKWLVLLFALIFVCFKLELLEGIFMVCGNKHTSALFELGYFHSKGKLLEHGIQWYIEKSAGVHLNCF